MPLKTHGVVQEGARVIPPPRDVAHLIVGQAIGRLRARGGASGPGAVGRDLMGEGMAKLLRLQLPAQHGADDGLARQALGVKGLDVAAGLLGFVAERHEAADRIHFCVAERIAGRCRAARKHAGPPVGDLIAQLDDQALGGVIPDPGEVGELQVKPSASIFFYTKCRS
jgi:hypothetical protein